MKPLRPFQNPSFKVSRAAGLPSLAASALLLLACSPEGSSPNTPSMEEAEPVAVSEASTTATDIDEAMTDGSNPLLAPSPLSYGLPPFDRIDNAHYRPAIIEGMAQHREEIALIANNPEPPSFDNTIVALERSGQTLRRVRSVFSNITGAHTNQALQAVQREVAPELAAHYDTISLNPALFSRIEQLYMQREELMLDAESDRLLDRYYTDFVRSGAKLDEAQQQRLREINTELAELSAAFTESVLAEVNDSAVLVDNRDALAGLPESAIQAAADAATERGHEGQYLITLLNTSGQPPLSSLHDRALRERIHQASISRGSRGNEFDTREIVSRTVRLRSERARLLGYDTHADYILEEQTASTPEAVNAMLSDLAPVAVANARAEGDDIQAMINNTEENAFQLAAWDWSYYAEQVRRERYNFDESEVKPYFELNSVLNNGVMFAAEQIYGIRFKPRDDLPTYHPDVQIWEAFDADGSAMGLMITDFYARSSKRGGAWMNSYSNSNGLLGGDKIIAMHLNISKPPTGEPTLLSFDEVTTMFHEFGHVLHGLFSDVQYPRFTGTAVPRDFVEFPSQVNEMWAVWPTVLENYARHYQTGERIPQALLDRVLAAEQFNQGYSTTEYLAASIIDQAIHQLPPEAIPGAEQLMEFEAQVLRDAGLDYAPVPPRYRYPYFSHIMGGYSAGYYSYIWSEVLDADTVEWFRENGGMTRENGDRFRERLLSRGGSEEAMALYEDFAGRQPDINHMLRRRGLLQ